MPYVIFYSVIISYVFSEATTTVPESFTNSTGKHVCIFGLEIIKLCKDICSTWISCTFAKTFPS